MGKHAENPRVTLFFQKVFRILTSVKNTHTMDGPLEALTAWARNPHGSKERCVRCMYQGVLFPVINLWSSANLLEVASENSNEKWTATFD